MPKKIMALVGVNKRRYRNPLSRCYEIAFRFVLDNDGWRLVHGTLDVADALGRPDEKYRHYKHAWAEKGNHVYDPTHNYFYLKKEYQRDFHTKAIKKYSRREACSTMAAAGHYGPWHE